MKKILTAFICITLGVMSGCQQPDDLKPSVSRGGINSIKAKFADGSGEFTGTITEGSNKIVIPIPYYFPESSNNQVTAEQLQHMRMSANLDDNVIISPALLYMDLNQENVITLTDQVKEKKEYIITSEIYKSNQCQIKEFALPSLGLTGIVNEESKTITLVTTDIIEPALAEVTLSYHATISPDPSVEKLDYEGGFDLTVTAHDGVSKSVYSVMKSAPNKLPYGIRLGSGKLMFAKHLKSDLGITVDNVTGGIAATKDFVAINTRNLNSIYIDPKNGEMLGEIELGAIKGGLTNFYSTADDAGNVLVCNLAPNAGSFKIWSIKGLGAAPELYIEYAGGQAMGRKMSIQGSINSDAIITAPILAAGQKFARWTVVGGVLTSQEPEIVTMSGLANGWGAHCDIVYTSNTDVTSDYYVASSTDNTFAWVDGSTNTVSMALDAVNTQFYTNAVDYTQFNNAKYTLHNWVNGYPYASADVVWLLDVTSSATFRGNPETGTCGAVVWECERNKFGANAVTPVVANANGTGDVAMVTSEDGFFLYVYFMFTNGYVVGYQFDCLDI
ncbi:DUF5018 domain-containing protein [Carboxylicivirga taeanensis]|uniref:DUF5018 domain-containing protein n=1 Tax=Carboxylicivirga taeanensis TaxID=1416875 RepID=UPI003F6DD096